MSLCGSAPVRTLPGAPIDHAVGVVVHAKAGTWVDEGQPLATVHAREHVDLDAVISCFSYVDHEPLPVDIVLEVS